MFWKQSIVEMMSFGEITIWGWISIVLIVAVIALYVIHYNKTKKK